MSDMPDADLVELASSINLDATPPRVTDAVKAAELTISVRIDHSEGARRAAL